MRLFNKLSNRRQRQLQGCYYFGCFAPLAFAVLTLMILVKWITDRVGTLYHELQ